jgi:type IV pilus assembly protein PilY1
MGDPLHSQPAAIIYGGSADSPDIVVFVGTNDGYSARHRWQHWRGAVVVRAERTAERHEPPVLRSATSNFKHYGIDGSIVPVVNDKNNNGEIEPGDGDFVYILFGMRRGGDSFYALDVTNKNAPVLKWVANYPEFGQSWSTPVPVRDEYRPPGAQRRNERSLSRRRLRPGARYTGAPG